MSRNMVHDGGNLIDIPSNQTDLNSEKLPFARQHISAQNSAKTDSNNLNCGFVQSSFNATQPIKSPSEIMEERMYRCVQPIACLTCSSQIKNIFPQSENSGNCKNCGNFITTQNNLIIS